MYVQVQVQSNALHVQGCARHDRSLFRKTRSYTCIYSSTSTYVTLHSERSRSTAYSINTKIDTMDEREISEQKKMDHGRLRRRIISY